MFTVKIATHFAASHQLNGYEGVCRALHGHTWKVEVSVRTEKVDAVGISVDFKELKDKTSRIIERLDHKHVNDVPPFDTINPTAENLARYIYNELRTRLPDGVSMAEVTVWESDGYALTYSE
ncbi:6-carboxytetrahydropterin synthase QueD [bacterium]|nr:6-carboxytetrahydropterin synthase QueD [bacterium]